MPYKYGKNITIINNKSSNLYQCDVILTDVSKQIYL